MKIKAFGWHVHMHTYIIVVSFSRFMFSSAIWLCNGPPLSSKFRQAKHWKEKFCEWIDSSNSLDGVGLEKRTCEGMVSQPPWIRQIMEYVIGPNKEGTEAEISFYVIMRKRELLVSDSFYVFSCAFYTVGLDFRWDCTSNEKWLRLMAPNCAQVALVKPMVTKMHEESLLLVGHVNDCLRWITGMGQPKIDLLVPVFVAAGSGGRSNNPIL